MHVKSKVVLGVLAALTAFALAACGGNGGSQGSDTPSTDPTPTPSGSEYTGPTGTITWVAWGSDAEIQCDLKAAQAFMDSHPGCTVIFEALNDSYQTTVETRFLGGQSRKKRGIAHGPADLPVDFLHFQRVEHDGRAGDIPAEIIVPFGHGAYSGPILFQCVI